MEEGQTNLKARGLELIGRGKGIESDRKLHEVCWLRKSEELREQSSSYTVHEELGLDSFKRSSPQKLVLATMLMGFHVKGLHINSSFLGCSFYLAPSR